MLMNVKSRFDFTNRDLNNGNPIHLFFSLNQYCVIIRQYGVISVVFFWRTIKKCTFTPCKISSASTGPFNETTDEH